MLECRKSVNIKLLSSLLFRITVYDCTLNFFELSTHNIAVMGNQTRLFSKIYKHKMSHIDSTARL